MSEPTTFESECWEWTRERNWKGYGVMRSGKQFRLAHRFAYEFAVGPIPAGMMVCHRCDNPACVRPGHLFLGTARDNYQDSKRKGRNLHGETHPRSKLTAEQVSEIRRRYQRGRSNVALYREFGITDMQMYRIVRRENWAHV